MTEQTDDHRTAAADIASRRRALKVNGGIYARRHAPGLMPLLVGTGSLRARYIAVIEWLGSEQDWRPEDARRLATIGGEIARLGLRLRDDAEQCEWHADRLRELVRQHDMLAQLQSRHRPLSAWSTIPAWKRTRTSTSRRRQA